ncbi:DUF4365 domain-containing protein [Tundrisphaera lichenicola]|uniref:DUF4365 domain-containing protein n=1 Tax=Tundrisphaera lichenicola TaxID=2029860 RepID=UPI003EB91207
MSSSDRIGIHGEFLFQAMISRRCNRKFYFHPIFMGEKHPTTDLTVELLDTTGVQSLFYVQVKSTTQGYKGSGSDKKLIVDVSRKDVERLKSYPGPTYLAGIDIIQGRGYLAGISADLTGPLDGLPTHHPIDCRNIRTLWAEVDSYWNISPRPIPLIVTKFAI